MDEDKFEIITKNLDVFLIKFYKALAENRLKNRLSEDKNIIELPEDEKELVLNTEVKFINIPFKNRTTNLIKSLLKKNGLFLRDIYQLRLPFKMTREIEKIAIKQDPRAIRFAQQKISKNDLDIFLTEHGDLFELLPLEYKKMMDNESYMKVIGYKNGIMIKKINPDRIPYEIKKKNQ